MKKLILASILTIGTAAGVLAQGTVVFESATATGTITFNSSAGPTVNANNTIGGTGYQVALLWAAGSSPTVAQGSLTQAIVFTGNFNGYFSDGTTVTIANLNSPTGGGVGVFEVQGWTGNYANYAAAMAGGAYVGQSAEFVNTVGNPNPPATAAVDTTGFNGNLILVVPEPSTILLGGLGAATLLLFRRRK